jgi:geranylgeranyl pyrophosphate synthase
MISYTLDDQTSSEYAFLFQYCFCRRAADAARVRKISAAAHLLQSSCMVSDDIFDGARRRYYKPAIHVRYGVSHAIIVTELLQCVAMETISAELAKGRFANKVAGLHIFHKMMTEMYLGQYLDIYNGADPRVTRRDYDRVIANAVGNYFANLARCAALFAGKSAAEVSSLEKFGYHYGMASMISDDVIDLLHRPERTGKNFATDLRGRKMRLPVVLALGLGTRGVRESIKRFLRGRKKSNAEVSKIAELIRSSGALEAGTQAARRHRDKSLDSLSGVKTPLTRKSLTWLAASLLRAQKLEE